MEKHNSATEMAFFFFLRYLIAWGGILICGVLGVIIGLCGVAERLENSGMLGNILYGGILGLVVNIIGLLILRTTEDVRDDDNDTCFQEYRAQRKKITFGKLFCYLLPYLISAILFFIILIVCNNKILSMLETTVL